MAKDPAVLFYPSDFLTGTMLMDYDTKGRYITLLSLQQQMGPIKEKNFKEICGDKIDELSEKFQQDSKGNYFNKRMKYEMERRKKFTESRRSNGSKGGRPPKAKEKQEESYEKPLGLSMDNLMGNENETVNRKGFNKEKEGKKEPIRHHYGEYKNVLLSDADYEKLKNEFVIDYKDRIENLSSYMESTGKSYKNHLATIRAWARKERRDANSRTDRRAESKAAGTEGNDYDYEKFFE